MKGEEMKKLFVSVPMRDRTEENIRKSIEKMHKIAEATVGEELELIESYIPDNASDSRSEAIFYLGIAIKQMATADYFITTDATWRYSGCDIEQHVARHYGIPTIITDIVFAAPDLVELINNECMTAVPVCG